MKARWLHRDGGGVLTLVFGGWALGPAPFLTLSGAGDVLFLEDYRDLDHPLSQRDDYDELRLLAFSFGVVSAAHWLSRTGVQPARRVAVSGTLFPADHRRGIPPDRVRATAAGLSPVSFARFCQRAGHIGPAPQIDIAAAQAELLAVIDRGAAPDPGFDRIWIPRSDRILPTSAQVCAWQGREDAVRLIPGPHVPFRAGQSWTEWMT
ncbi:pimeloyl-ACP methyl esterase BioG family protein [Shimia sp.]|uniref:pimeloyl-ACP methyl esterase BioG family protein n=1 Tax=Shimia sp. TaxID=1954381 RepID=UPI00356B2885